MTALLFASCEKEKFTLGSVAQIKPMMSSGASKTQSSRAKAASTDVSYEDALRIVKECTHMMVYEPLPEFGGEYKYVEFRMWNEYKDTISAVPSVGISTYMFKGTDGSWRYDWCDAVDVVLLKFIKERPDGVWPNRSIFDTLAYIPNSVMKEVGEELRTAIQKEDAVAATKILRDKYKFIPITGAEWRELKKNGLN